MRPETENLLRQLEDAAWFAAVGQPLPDGVRGSVVPVASWAEAVACCSSDEWENLTLEKNNELSVFVDAHARDRFRQWNDMVDAIKALLLPLVQRKLPPAVAEVDVPDGPVHIRHAVEWDIVGACLELEYGDVRGPGFCCGLMTWYLLGRFPCGWGERAEDGSIRVYGPEEVGEADPGEGDALAWVHTQQERLLHPPQIVWPRVGKLLVF